MFGLTLSTTVDTLIVVAVGAVAVWRGCPQRRAYWSRGSWIRFGLTALAGLGLIGCTLALAAAVDHHAPWVGAPGSTIRGMFVVAAVTCLVGGTLVVTVSLAWFAGGNPAKQFRPLRLIRSSMRYSFTAREEIPARLRSDD